jgi:hypothetical protein
MDNRALNLCRSINESCDLQGFEASISGFEAVTLE